MTAIPATLGTRERPGALVRTLQRLTKVLFVTLIVRPVLWLFLGLEVRNASRLPKHGPAIFVANHNSHFDALAILSILELPLLAQAHPVGAEDYFFKTPLRAAFSRWFLGIVPLARTATKARRDVLEDVVKTLEHGKIIVFFPEGSRGGTGRVGSFKRGISALAKRCPNVPIIPLYLAGFSKVLPKGASFPLPMLCSISVGDRVVEHDNSVRRAQLPDLLHKRVVELGGQAEEQIVGATSVSLLSARRDP